MTWTEDPKTMTHYQSEMFTRWWHNVLNTRGTEVRTMLGDVTSRIGSDAAQNVFVNMFLEAQELWFHYPPPSLRASTTTSAGAADEEPPF